MLQVAQVKKKVVSFLFARQEAGLVKSPHSLEKQVSHRVLRAFRRAAKSSAAYRTILKEHGVDPLKISSINRFREMVPILNKKMLFERFSLDEIYSGFHQAGPGRVWSSSGTSGALTVGFESADAAPNSLALDFMFNLYFKTLSRKTLFINTLPDGWPITSKYIHYANVGTRIDTAQQLIMRLASLYQQFIVGGEPLLLKRLVEDAACAGVDFSAYRIHLVVGGDYVPLALKTYLTNCLNPNKERSASNQVVSVMGLSEFGVATFFETEAMNNVAHQAATNPSLTARLKGPSHAFQLFQYDPLTTFVESIRGSSGHERLILTNLNIRSELPLIRYDTGDLGRVFTFDEINRIISETGGTPPPFKMAFPAVMATGKPRFLETKTKKIWVVDCAECLLSIDVLLPLITGLFRLTKADGEAAVAIQLKQGVQPSDVSVPLAAQVTRRFESLGVAASIVPFESFDNSIGLRFDRKFNFLG